MHINDAPAGIPIEQHHDSNRCLPGETGVIDLVGFLEAMRSIGYDGPVTPEPFIDKFGEMEPRDVLTRIGASLQAVWAHPRRTRLPEKMEVITIGDGRARVTDAPLPQPEGNQVVIKLCESPACGCPCAGTAARRCRKPIARCAWRCTSVRSDRTAFAQRISGSMRSMWVSRNNLQLKSGRQSGDDSPSSRRA